MKYFEILTADIDAVIWCMKQNLEDDIAAGYDPNGRCVMRQRLEIAEYSAKCAARVEIALLKLAEYGEASCERFCRAECIRRGAILPGE